MCALGPTVRISFEGSSPDDTSPRVVLYNPEVLTSACLTQLQRFGLIGDRRAALTGTLKGSRDGLSELSRTYGNDVQIVRPAAPNRIG